MTWGFFFVSMYDFDKLMLASVVKKFDINKFVLVTVSNGLIILNKDQDRDE